MSENTSKKVLLKNFYVILIIFIGWVTIWVGAFGKVTSMPWGNVFLTYGILIQILGCVLGIIKVLTLKDINKIRSNSEKIQLKTKYIVLIILLGSIISSGGALAKITSMSWSDIYLKIGFLFQIFGYFLGVLKLLSLKQVRDFLKS